MTSFYKHLRILLAWHHLLNICAWTNVQMCGKTRINLLRYSIICFSQGRFICQYLNVSLST